VSVADDMTVWERADLAGSPFGRVGRLCHPAGGVASTSTGSRPGPSVDGQGPPSGPEIRANLAAGLKDELLGNGRGGAGRGSATALRKG
jgi:hypothetical protein